MGVRKHLLIVSSDYTCASLLDLSLNDEFEIHAASSDSAAFALLDSYSYACVVIDLSTQSVAGSQTVSMLQLNALLVPVVALVPPAGGTDVPSGAIVCVNDGEPIPLLVDAIRRATA